MKKLYRRTPLIAALLAAVFLVAMTPAIAQSHQCTQCGPVCKKTVDPHAVPGKMDFPPMHHHGISCGGDCKGTWVTCGPEGYSAAGVTVDPANADNATLVGYYGNCYTTVDGGASWSLTGNHGISAFGCDCIDNSRLYAVGMGASAPSFVGSTDQGATWTEYAFDFSVGYPYSVGAHPTDPNTIYVGGYLYDFTGPSYDLWFHKSTDGGATFTSAAIGLPGVPFGLAAAPTNGNLIYMTGWIYDFATYTILPGVWQSGDGGTTWTDLSANVSTDPADGFFQGIAVDPNDENHVIAAGVYVYETFDGGATWTKHTYGGDSFYAYQVAFDPTNSANIYMAASDGVYVTNDGGATWTLMPQGGFGNAVTVAPSAPSTVYGAWMYIGPIKSTDSGATWDNCCNDIYEAMTYGLHVSGTTPETAYVSPYGHAALMINHNSGDKLSWQEMNTPPEGTYVSRTLECSAYPNIILIVLPGG